MAEPIPVDEQSNYETFRDCLSEPVLKALAIPQVKQMPKEKRHAKKNSKDKRGKYDEIKADVATVPNGDAQASDAEDLGEFIKYLSSVMFPCLPAELRVLSYTKYRDSTSLQDTYSTPLSASTYTRLLGLISPDAIDSLESYGLLPPSSDTNDQRNFLLPVLNTYASSATAPPPMWSTTRTTECELCQRDWVPLTYHHLIPRSTHDRVLKRGWHAEEKLNSVAWLCRACHSFVHRLANNEELAKSYYTVELIGEGGVERDSDKRAEVEGWVKWVGGVRWKSR
ncbi:hypothetical protein EK21DRAFT_62242 [Setomelanomma holmii]|uniref:HNH endonuclease n=1 Tax=Setomelanomma holmii TaxID=210430 RepID=A0A9P4LQH9_9PLEO|nr:hypothetical protein EK21DRAFT_62242 [Setomelanomma holmii]